eukprot:Pgem_evm1s3274
MKISYSLAFIASIVALTKVASTGSSPINKNAELLNTISEQEKPDIKKQNLENDDGAEIKTTTTTETTSTLTSEELPVEGTDEKAMQDIWWGAYPA